MLWNESNKKYQVGQVSTNAPFNVDGSMNNHIIPDTTDTYDVGSDELKYEIYLFQNVFINRRYKYK